MAQIKKLKTAEKAKNMAHSEGCLLSNASQASHFTSTSELGVAVDKFPNTNPPFSQEDFKNICLYLEDKCKFKELDGSGSKIIVWEPVKNTGHLKSK
ncbi:hypothetical protein VP01_2392g2 [Puccinia sorghi]|uniref:Uncharacterized protein n=1 Tax=Puccinia sorghi TaxID=27349 RepID=A0A0L6V7J0_9BASI|nr:hypothetical protein VP01_2392g2 [Puccinia sorghi]